MKNLVILGIACALAVGCSSNPTDSSSASPSGQPSVLSSASTPPEPSASPSAQPSSSGAISTEEWVNPKDGMVLLLIPEGPFKMGSGAAMHEVTLKPYYIGKNEVTNAQFRAFVKASGYDAGKEWERYAKRHGDQTPVVNLNRADAEAYCAWAGVRLPTEEEWEKAARGPDGREYPWGSSWDEKKLTWRKNTQFKNGHSLAAEVGSTPEGASPYGCLDMAGNAQEWTSSSYGEKSDEGVVRGGGWDNEEPEKFLSSRRTSVKPGERWPLIGFRCAKSH